MNNLGQLVGRVRRTSEAYAEAAEMDYLIDYGEWSSAASARAEGTELNSIAAEAGFEN